MICRRPILRAQSGFTLIELLVVLAIAGAIGALVAPNMWNSYQRSSERHQVLNFANELMALRRELHFSGSSISLAEDVLVTGGSDTRLPNLPEGWLVASQSPIYFLPTGVTNGGLIVFNSPLGRVWELAIQPLDGQIKISSQ